ncbi:GPALPP motifs-containing protein 1-like [Ananas comosus]|uniref:GPALPP motifs-containing protein 1-like n=1 Tax=Ananas comosus TaxID=4615 RepID=A0A199V9K5_ANACO|nr:GPALPP motifs-containing protein 1-like [Ananas comosus]OAY73480.1 hypothetical protein ACMD2_08967 [Ananas comosus]
MRTHSPSLLKHPRSLAIALSLFLLLLCSCYCNISLFSAFLTLLVLSFSTCSLSLFSELRRLRETESAAKPPSSEQEEEEKGEKESSKKSASETGHLTRSLDESSKEDAISDDDDDDDDDDDESLIEIALPEGSYAGDDGDGPDLSEFSPESVLKQNGLMDQLLAEISEEDNLIEIDIARGSIKCSRLGI